MSCPRPRFTTLSTLQPGIMSVYEALLTPGGATLHTQPLPKELVGAMYMQTRRRFDKGIVCGFIRDDKLQLLPSDSESEVREH